MTTIREVASLAGVSTATVSHVINNSRHVAARTRARVQNAIEELGYCPNPAGRALALNRGRTAGGHEIPGVSSAHPPSSPTLSRRHAHLSAKFKVEAAAGSSTVVALLRLLRARQPVSRADIARYLGIHRSSVTEIVKPLLTHGVLREAEQLSPLGVAGGRPATGLVFDADAKYFIGVNIGVRQSQTGAVTIDDRVLAEESFETPREAEEALWLVSSAIARLRSRVTDKRIVSVGVSVPGPTSGERLLYAPRLGWHDVAVGSLLEKSPSGDAAGEVPQDLSDVPVVVENDARAAALYESRRHLSAEGGDVWRDFILVRAGTGIGVGLVLGGEVYRGADANGGWAGEFGHMTIVADGKPCSCGNRGCWEVYASASTAASLYTGDRAVARDRTPRFVEIVARAEAGERRAQATLERIGNYLGIGIANVITGLGVPRVIVSGRVVHGWRFMREPLHRAVGRTMAGRLAEWSVVAGSATGSGLGGAIEVAVEQYIIGINQKISTR